MQGIMNDPEIKKMLKGADFHAAGRIARFPIDKGNKKKLQEVEDDDEEFWV